MPENGRNIEFKQNVVSVDTVTVVNTDTIQNDKVG